VGGRDSDPDYHPALPFSRDLKRTLSTETGAPIMKHALFMTASALLELNLAGGAPAQDRPQVLQPGQTGSVAHANRPDTTDASTQAITLR
jgi:hypothetical protein